MTLKPCPLDGGEAAYEERHVVGPQYWVYCTGCGLCTADYPSLEAAREHWNRREPHTVHLPHWMVGRE